jgi:hypothetical protein
MERKIQNKQKIRQPDFESFQISKNTKTRHQKNIIIVPAKPVLYFSFLLFIMCVFLEISKISKSGWVGGP